MEKETTDDIKIGLPQSNYVNSVLTAFLPCVTFGQIAEVSDEGEMRKASSLPPGSFIYLLMMPAFCSQWIMGSKYRTKLRQRYNLVEAPYTDVISHVFRSSCSLCQEFRQLRNRGFDPALGWNGILVKRTEDRTTEIPPRTQAM
ncbi:LOW QUALITY PROTEIN: protein PLANT CADMIUM RESISTANCE 8 [Prunus dulcis]|uniref:LOW QUALITY PROTEIN: protein PLANT CADMIUM RESISTANCE 8 n=1 Tax=Prunus dulcis TaxID=3755 RepID=UPI001481FCB5|nr:LOW QUALITY PROTEIN: protein PLANT CADMIUM RESISTANCE 8 [Prunus dulcis]